MAAVVKYISTSVGSSENLSYKLSQLLTDIGKTIEEVKITPASGPTTQGLIVYYDE